MKLANRIAIGSLLCAAVLAATRVDAQIADAPDASIAGIPVNYTEAKVGKITLPDVLKTFDGESVTDAKTWFEKRRPELIKYFETEYYGKVPATAPKVTWQVVSTDPNALEGKAIMKVLAGHMGSADGPAISVTLYTPANSTKPVPVLTALSMSFGVGVSAGRARARGAGRPARRLWGWAPGLPAAARVRPPAPGRLPRLEGAAWAGRCAALRPS
jgi:hypothetical protein